MKIKMAIAQGYVEGEIKGFIEANAGLSASEATAQWVEQKYGRWIKENLETEYDIRLTDSDTSFVIGFPTEELALKYRELLGGHVIGDKDA
ncbi:hypothetical protein [Brucella rhizosphaerae]|uniref:Uncharacterized protein n=1 Tax=Brucella rhizosphaerae TaxID=571254 RepID=A0A256F8T3_9HYPH|nr:hypothetical protein [Brucella rhizosphaerae]OYR11183.1 hypothetical protein CEV32_1481 [Brucella rhizosphaerae]